MKWLAVFTFAGFHCVAQAFERVSEYRGLDIKEVEAFDNPQLIDAEYQSDYLAFRPHLREENPARRQELSATVGSLGAKDFMVHQDLRLNFDLGNQVGFGVRQFYVNDFEVLSRHNVYEFSKRCKNKNFGFAVFGEPTGEKEETDVGLAYLFGSERIRDNNYERISNRLYVQWPEFQRNHRNDEADYFKTAPIVYGYQRIFFGENCGQKSCNHFLKLGARLETPVRWVFPQHEWEYRFARHHVGLSGRKPIATEKFGQGLVNYRAEWLHKREAKIPDAINSAEEKWISKRMMAEVSYEVAFFEPGLMVTFREWKRGLANGGHGDWDRLTAYYSQPYLWWRFSPNWRAGAELTITDVRGEIIDVQEPRSVTEARINLEWSRAITDSGSIAALFSFDGDELFTSESWEGGNVRISLGF